MEDPSGMVTSWNIFPVRPSTPAHTPSFGLQIALFYRIITNCFQQGPLIRMHYPPRQYSQYPGGHFIFSGIKFDLEIST
jgi:hypothetical protein